MSTKQRNALIIIGATAVILLVIALGSGQEKEQEHQEAPEDYKSGAVIETPLGKRVQITVEGFKDNPQTFKEAMELIIEEEELLGLQFPSPKVTIRKVESWPDTFCGHNILSYKSAYTGFPYEVETSIIEVSNDFTCNDTFGILAHELAHTWFNGSEPANWIDEGIANSIEQQIKERHVKYLTWSPGRTLCITYANISELEQATPERTGEDYASGFTCNYQLGNGIFGDLRQHLGDESFNKGIAEIAKRLAIQTDNPVSVKDVETNLGLTPGALKIIKEWYSGTPNTN